MKAYAVWLGLGFLVLALAVPPAPAEGEDSLFDMVVVAISPSVWASIKYQCESGQAWTARDGQWIAIKDEEAPVKGRYVVKMTGLSNGWSALRLETRSGRTWQCLNDAWVEIKLAEEAAVEIKLEDDAAVE